MVSIQHTHQMTTEAITMKSTKAQIVEAAEELISYQENKLKVLDKKIITLRQLLKTVTVLLALTFILAPAF